MMSAHERALGASAKALSHTKDAQKPALLAVACEAATLRAKSLHQASSGSRAEDVRRGLSGIADQMLQLVSQNSSNYSVVGATAEILYWAKEAGKELPLSALQVICYLRGFCTELVQFVDLITAPYNVFPAAMARSFCVFFAGVGASTF